MESIKELSFTAGFIDQNYIGNPPEKATFRVIADGKEVDNVTVKYGELPVSRTVSIRNCKQLQISVYSYQGMASCAESKSTLETEYSGRNDFILKKVSA